MTTRTVYRRYPLGLPAGSVRSVLTIMVAIMICTLVLLSPMGEHGPLTIPPYLIYLLFLMIGSFFAAHGGSIGRTDLGEPSPLYMPRGTIRLLILIGLVATVIWKIVNQPEDWAEQLDVTVERFKEQPYLPLAILGAFFFGHLVRMVFSGVGNSRLYQDLLAWVAIVAMVLLFIDGLIITVINPSLVEHRELDLSVFEAILAGIIAFYFAARS